MKKQLLFLVFICVSLVSSAQTNDDETAIRNILTEQVTAWNNGNLDDFMKGYWHSDSLMFIGKNGPIYGYDKALANYKRGYPDTVRMGKFTSTIVSVQKLSNEYYFVVGKWFLKRTISDANGIYSLLFRKINGQWFIISDHSSS
jgi:ketosteroid isomerase-like protein